ncbi:MAG: hypothetical protein KJO52_03725, partial [Maribacter sp.]|nr:hypothetical protein [Maribacter sp.]
SCIIVYDSDTQMEQVLIPFSKLGMKKLSTEPTVFLLLIIEKNTLCISRNRIYLYQAWYYLT